MAVANNEITSIGSEAIERLIADSDLVVLQNEIPQEQIISIIDIANRLAVPVLYNPAPA